MAIFLLSIFRSVLSKLLKPNSFKKFDAIQTKHTSCLSIVVIISLLKSIHLFFQAIPFIGLSFVSIIVSRLLQRLFPDSFISCISSIIYQSLNRKSLFISTFVNTIDKLPFYLYYKRLSFSFRMLALNSAVIDSFRKFFRLSIHDSSKFYGRLPIASSIIHIPFIDYIRLVSLSIIAFANVGVYSFEKGDEC